MNNALIAASRFGMGSGSPDAADAKDPRSWLRTQLQHPDTPHALTGLDTAAGIVTGFEQFRKSRTDAGGDVDKIAALEKRHQEDAKALYLKEVGVRFDAATTSKTPLCERLVAFWSNHFTVSGIRGEVKPLVGSYEREAIRPHITGRFEDMVRAVVMHPAMGMYLDSAFSVGPNSIAGQRRKAGINENLGRELLELHTLGVDGGYTEQDVRALARILTGWSIARLEQPESGHFTFNERMHEPGSQTLLGKVYDQDGKAQGDAAITDICRHPSTARHIARQLAIHFVSDHPSPDVVEHLATVFRNNDGHLGKVGEALIDQTESWTDYSQKVKDPWDLVVSASIATGITLPPDQIASFLDRLGQPVFMAPQPSGWPDDAASWIGPESVLRRVEWCSVFAGHADPGLDPVAVADRTFLGTLATPAADAIAHAESRHTALAMLLASPQFQRR